MPEKHVSLFQKYFDSKGIKVLEKAFPKDPTKIDFDEAEDLYKQNLKKLKESDVIVAEVSFVSSDTGYFIAEAIQEKKPVLVFFNMSEGKENPRHMRIVPVGLKGNKNKYLILKEYDGSNLEKLLDIALADAKALADTKFILIIPPEIDRYLEWNVKEKGISKAEITRQAVEEKMALDKEYTEHVKSYSPDESASE